MDEEKFAFSLLYGILMKESVEPAGIGPASLQHETNAIVLMKTNSWSVALWALVLTLSRNARADVVDYAVTSANQLGTIDLQTGVFTQVGTVNGIAGATEGDVTRLPGGLLYGVDSTSRLVLIDPVALTTSLVGPCGNSIFALAFRKDGALFGASGSRLFTINPNTGAASLVGEMGVSSSYWDIKFDDSGQLYLAAQTSLFKVNTSTGQATLVGAIGFPVWALNFENGTLYGFTTVGQITSINTTTGAGTLVSTQTQSHPIIGAAPGGGVTGAPYLTIQQTNVNSAVLFWIAPSNAFRLQQNPDLTTPNWASVTNSVSVTNSQNQVIVSPAIGHNFYRLLHP